jgi:general secretion pathway protein D
MKRKLFLILTLLVLAAGPVVPQQQPPAQTEPASPPLGPLNLQNASLREVIDQFARMLRINVIIDDKVNGGVTINTYGSTDNLDPRNLLELILRLNNAGMVQEGPIYRIVPMNQLVRQPFTQLSDSKDIPDDDRTMLNLIFLKYVTVDEVSKILTEFTDDRTLVRSYAPANLLFIMDSRRNMRRIMDLIALFDSDNFAGERIRLFDIKNTLPSELLKDLDSVLKSISLDSKTSTVRFLPVDRISKLIAVAPNPGVFERVETWIKTLDIPISETSVVVDTYIYHVNYGRAECIAMALTQLYYPEAAGMMGAYGNPYGAQNGGGQYGGGQYGGGQYGGGQYGANGGFGAVGGGGGGYGNQNNFQSGFGGAGGCGMMMGGMGGMGGGGYGAGGLAYGQPAFGGYAAQVQPLQQGGGLIGGNPAPNANNSTNALAGALLGNTSTKDGAPPRIVANPLDNSLIIQANPQQYQSILKILKELDRPPRQILLEAKIYEVAMGGSFTARLSTLLQANTGGDRRLLGSLAGAATNLQAGFLVGQARQLMAFLELQENSSNVRTISHPTLIATDSIPAHISVGAQVPILTGTIANLGGANTVTQQGISSRNTGVTLQVNARINPSGIVTLIVNQEVSNQASAGTTALPTPTFNQRVVQTQVTMQDGDTIAIGGIVSDDQTSSKQGFPGLNKIPYLGAIFGGQTRSNAHSEMVLFMTPHVIYDNNDLLEASDQVKNNLRRIRKYIVE